MREKWQDYRVEFDANTTIHGEEIETVVAEFKFTQCCGSVYVTVLCRSDETGEIYALYNTTWDLKITKKYVEEECYHDVLLCIAEEVFRKAIAEKSLDLYECMMKGES